MVRIILLLSCYLLFWIGVSSNAVYPPKTEKDLINDLFRNYNKLVRPVKDPETPVDVEVSVTPLKIREVDEKHQIFVLETYFLLKWKDQYLTWDPEKYGNLNELRIAPCEVWKPDIALYSAFRAWSLFPSAHTQVLIDPSGDMLWMPPFNISSRCHFSKQTDNDIKVCNIKFESWTHPAKELNPILHTAEVDTSQFQDTHPGWKLKDVKSNRVSKFYPCCPDDEFPNLFFNVTLQRRSLDMTQE